MKLTPPLAVPRTAAYFRLRSCLDSATDPNFEPAARKTATLADSLGPAFRVRLKSRRFRVSPKLFAFLQFGIGGQMLRFHPFAASAGDYEFRIAKSSGLAYLTEPKTGRTWVFTLEPFRSARRAGREASAVAIREPFANLDAARWGAPRFMHVAKWLKAQYQNLPGPSRDGQPLPVVLSGAVVAGFHIIDPVTGRQLVTLRSHSLAAGQGYVTVQKDALRLSQGSTVVYFPVKDLLARWGNQITRNAIYASAEEARQRAAELGIHLALGRFMTQLLGSSQEPTSDLLAQLATFSAAAETVCSDRRGSIGLALTLPKRFGGRRRIAFRLMDFGPHARLKPGLCWVSHQGLMVLWTAADGNVAAFGVSRSGVRRIGVFPSVESARTAAALNPASLVQEALVRKREPGSNLSGRIAQFNHFDVTLNADERRVPLVNVFTGTKIQFRTTSWRGQWSPKILLSPAGPILVMFAKTSVRQPAWLAYRPLAKEAKVSQLVLPSAEGRGRPSLEAMAVLLSKQFSIRVTVAGPEQESSATLDDMHSILRRVVPDGLQNWLRKERDTRVRQFYELAGSLREALLSLDVRRKREALMAAEYFYFGKPTDQILNFHAPLFKADSEAWSAHLGEGGRADIRAKELVRSLGSFVSECPKQGLPITMQSRFSKFQDAVIQFGDAVAIGNEH